MNTNLPTARELRGKLTELLEAETAWRDAVAAQRYAVLLALSTRAGIAHRQLLAAIDRLDEQAGRP